MSGANANAKGGAGAGEPDRVPVPLPHVCAAYIDDEAVLYDVARARPVLLNVTASAVWAAIDGERTVAEITSMLAELYGADEPTVRPGVTSTLVSFDELGLLQGVPPSSVT